MKIGFYGGSFDPLHLGHLNMAIEIKERAGLDEVWFCPAYISPDKQAFPVPGSLRLTMIHLAIEEIPGFRVIDDELRREGVSYTVETLQTITKAYPDHQFFILLGEDTLNNFSNWWQPQEILNLAVPLIGSRSSYFLPKDLKWSDREYESFSKGWFKIPLFEISSTVIRSRLQQGLYCGHLLPRKVLDFIIKNELYLNNYERLRSSSTR
ncbi:MAG: nicotinate (nicotinamide) nucleotide adenylyltransferase [Parachlamydiaceae bacterium]